jgi:hypothetical protein
VKRPTCGNNILDKTYTTLFEALHWCHYTPMHWTIWSPNRLWDEGRKYA